MADQRGSDDRERSLYLTQVRFLDEQLERCQLRCDALQTQNSDLVLRCDALQTDAEDIVQHMKRSAAAQESRVEELVERLEGEQRVARRDREALKLRQRQEVEEAQERAEGLDSERRLQVVKQEQEEQQLEQQLSHMEVVVEELVRQREELEDVLHGLWTEAALEEDRLIEDTRNTVPTKISEVLLEERARHCRQLEELQARVQVLVNKNMDFFEEKCALQDQETRLRSDVDTLRKDLDRVSQRLLNHKTGAERLRKQCQQLRTMERKRRSSHEHLLKEEEALRLRLASVSEQRRQRALEVTQLREEVQRARGRRRQLEGDLQEATVIVRRVLQDSEGTPETLQQTRSLLEILESAARPGTGPAPETSQVLDTNSPTSASPSG